MIGLIDRRLSHFKTASKMKICDYVSPKTVSLHPTKTNVVFLAPIDKGCGIFDMRKQVKRNNGKGDSAISSIEPLVHLKVRYSQKWFAQFNGLNVPIFVWLGLLLRALPDITSGLEVRQIVKIRTVLKPDVFHPGRRTFENRKKIQKNFFSNFFS